MSTAYPILYIYKVKFIIQNLLSLQLNCNKTRVEATEQNLHATTRNSDRESVLFLFFKIKKNYILFKKEESLFESSVFHFRNKDQVYVFVCSSCFLSSHLRNTI